MPLSPMSALHARVVFRDEESSTNCFCRKSTVLKEAIYIYTDLRSCLADILDVAAIGTRMAALFPLLTLVASIPARGYR